MQHYQDVLLDRSGNAIAGAIITVTNHLDGLPAILYADYAGTIVLTSIVTDFDGSYSFYFSSGRYDFSFYKYGLLLKTQIDVFVDQSTGLQDLSAPTGASLVGFQQSGTGAIATTVNAKIKQQVSVLDFGADPTGVDDSTAAIQYAINYVHSLGGGAVYLPSGTYLKSKTNATPAGVYLQITLYDNITLYGDGESSIIKFADSSAIGRRDLLTISNTTNVTLKDFAIIGDWDAYPNQTNQSQCLVGTNVTNLRLLNLTIKKVRFMATAFDTVTNALVSGCTLDTVARDGFRFVDSKNIRIENNNAKYVGDNPVALHTSNTATQPLSSGDYVVIGNTFEQCLFSLLMGGKKIVYSNNTHKYCVGGVATGYSASTEGDSPQYGIVIDNNIFIDTWGTYGSANKAPIQIVPSLRNAGGLAAIPGFADSATGTVVQPYGYFDTNNTTTANQPNPNAHWIKITNNVCTRTLAIGALFNAANLGQRFDPNYYPTTGFYDATLADTNLSQFTLDLRVGGFSDLLIQGNSFHGTQVTLSDCAHIHWYESVSSGDNFNIQNCKIIDNTFVDCPRGAIRHNQTALTTHEIIISGNQFNCDPYFRNPLRVAGNKWTTIDDCRAIIVNNITGSYITNNTFKNCSWTGILEGTSRYIVKNNIIFAQYSALGFNANNRGVGTIPISNGADITVVNIQGDPTLANFETVNNGMPLVVATSIPTTGTYVAGYFVANGSASSTVIGWRRITSGSNHVLNTDWAECVTLPAQASSSGKLLTTDGTTPSFSNTLTSLTTTGNISVGDSLSTSAFNIGTFGAYIGRDSVDGALAISAFQAALSLKWRGTEKIRMVSTGELYVEAGTLWTYTPAPVAISAVTTLTAANLRSDIISTTGTSYNVTLPTGAQLDTEFSSAPVLDIGFEFHVINTASGTITMVVGASGMTSLGSLTILTGSSAIFKLRRSAANTYILYRLN